ncbi:EamA family transporter [Candidatus Nomurabacteria bacterium]|nr:EamA family transporter [Candidatus Nomurabacteria bacterium]
MYHWLLIAIWAPLLWAFANHIDKYLINKFGTGMGIKGLITFSSLSSFFVLIFVFIFNSHVLFIDLHHKVLLLISGFLSALATLCYLFALNEGEASTVTPVFQLIPFFAFILGYFFLGEKLSNSQMLGGLIVVLGAIFISLDFKNLKFNKKAFYFIALASFLFAVYQILFRAGAVDSFSVSIFWQLMGTFFAGLCFLCIKNYRQDFLSIFKNKNKKSMISWSLAVEAITLGGNILISKAITLAPATALVLLVEAFQPMCVFVLGIIITLFFPFFGKETLNKEIIIQKFIAIIILLLGSYFLYF